MSNPNIEKLTPTQKFLFMEVVNAVKCIDREDYGHHRFYYGLNRTPPDPGDYGFHFRGGHFIPTLLEDFTALENTGFFEVGEDGRFKSLVITGVGFLMAARKFNWSREALILNAAFVRANGSDRRPFDAFHVAKLCELPEAEVAEFLYDQVRKGMLSINAGIGCFYYKPEGLAMVKELRPQHARPQTLPGVHIDLSNATVGALHTGWGDVSGIEQRIEHKDF